MTLTLHTINDYIQILNLIVEHGNDDLKNLAEIELERLEKKE